MEQTSELFPSLLQLLESCNKEEKEKGKKFLLIFVQFHSYTTINGHLVDAGYGYSDSFIISGSTASIALGLGILLFLRTPPTAKETVPSPINPEEIQSLLN